MLCWRRSQIRLGERSDARPRHVPQSANEPLREPLECGWLRPERKAVLSVAERT